MTGQKDKFTGVIMGDLVKSRGAGSIAALHAAFNTAIARTNSESNAALLSPLTITLGDEFQGLTHTVSDAATVARQLRYDLLRQDISCRFVIGLAKLETPVNSDKAWNMMGDGLATARTMLNDKSDALIYKVSLPHHPLHQTLLNALGAGLGMIERNWTAQQQHDIMAMMDGTAPSALAQERGVTVHSIYKVRSSGEFDTYVTQWQAMMSGLQDIDRQVIEP